MGKMPTKQLSLRMYSDEEIIQAFKTMPCSRTSPHDWTLCFFHHKSERAGRRDLQKCGYSAMMCPEMLHKNSCSAGDACLMAHNVFEYHLHPEKFKTKMCTAGANCQRPVCFYAHKASELRTSPSKQAIPTTVTSSSLSSNSCSSSSSSDSSMDSASTSSSPVPQSNITNTTNTAAGHVQVVSAPPLLHGCSLFTEVVNAQHHRQPQQTRAMPAVGSASSGVAAGARHNPRVDSPSFQSLWQQQQQQQQQHAWTDQFAMATPAAGQLTALQAEMAIRHQEAALAAAASAASEAAAAAAGSLYIMQQKLAGQRAILNMQGGSSMSHDVQMNIALSALPRPGLPADGAMYLPGASGLQLGQDWTAGVFNGSLATCMAPGTPPAWNDMIMNAVLAHPDNIMLALQLQEQQQLLLVMQQQQQMLLRGPVQGVASDWVLPDLPN